jgi:hypothetical protein
MSLRSPPLPNRRRQPRRPTRDMRRKSATTTRASALWSAPTNGNS